MVNKDKLKLRVKYYRSVWTDWFYRNGYTYCEFCKYDTCKRALEFHHIDSELKRFSISQWIQCHAPVENNELDLEEELKNCVLLCSNCHRELHAAIDGMKKEENKNGY
jgi:hypothetical protein